MSGSPSQEVADQLRVELPENRSTTTVRVINALGQTVPFVRR
ncbi:MAG: hypothetical protein WBA12_12875 [Catalinimonas sp.]